MKRCPKCEQTYVDDALNFCLVDGTPLIAATGEIPTVVMPRPDKPSRGRGLMWAGLIVFFILAAAAFMAAVLVWNSSRRDDQRTAVNIGTAQTPSQTPKPKASPSAATSAEPSPTSSANADTDDEDASDEVTPIAWETNAGGFKGEPGKTYKFECTKGGSAYAVYGSDVYTDYSSICTAAVHAGIITLSDGGIVTLEYRPGRQIYGSTTRNDIKSNTTGEHTRSFVVKQP